MDLFRVKSLPFLARRNYYYEMWHLLPWSVLAGLVEGHFASIVVAKTFQGSPRMIAVAAATPAAAFMFSLVWGMLCVGRPKVRVLSSLAIGAALLTGLIGLIPASPDGATWFICQMAAAQILLSGVVTVRTAVWRANYPHLARGRITARLHATRFVVSVSTVLIAAYLCDRSDTAYQYIFPASAVVGLLGIAALGRIHIRGERTELARHGRGATLDVGQPERVGFGAVLSPRRVLGQMVRVLNDDRTFARYCAAQSLVGVANFMTIPVVVTVIARTLDLGDNWGFWISTGLIQAIPQFVRLACIGRWARYFDRVGVVQFRVLNVTCWTFSIVVGLIATVVAVHADRFGAVGLPLAVGLFALRAVGTGIGLGGGALAWNLGHLHFARAEAAEVYMGVHVFLTGVRGMVAPLLGMLLFQAIGWYVWCVALALSVASVRMYVLMARRERLEMAANRNA